MTHKPRKGRKPSHFTTANGKTIPGLRRDPKSGRFYPVGKGSPSFGSDEPKAIHRFRLWQAKQGKPDTLEDRSSADDLIVNELDAESLAALDPELLLASPIVAEVFKSHYRSLIYSNPKQAAIELDCEPLGLLANVENLKPPTCLPLTGLGTEYASKEFRDKNEAPRSRRIWREFCQAVQPARTVEDVTTAQLQAYANHIIKKKLAPKSISNVYAKIGGILKYAHAHHKAHRKAIADLRADFHLVCLKHAPKVPKPIPKFIEPKEFGILFENADIKWKAILLTMLNCGLNPGELATLHKQDVPFPKKWLWDLRNKTTNQRCSILWTRTIEAIQAYQEAAPHDSEFLFVNNDGAPYSTWCIDDNFKARTKVLDRTVTPTYMRKGGTHAAGEFGVDSDLIKMWLGHDRGVECETHNPRMPSKTKPVVDAIEAAFFGGKK